MPLKVRYPLPLVGLEPYQLGVQIRAKKKIMLSYFDKKVLFLKDEKMVKTTRKIFTNGVNLSEI